jgi:hypothetical protein
MEGERTTVDSDTFSNSLSALLTKEEPANCLTSTADSHGEEELIQASRPSTARREGSSLIRLVSDGPKSIKWGTNETLWTQIDDLLEQEGKWLKAATAAAAPTDGQKDEEEGDKVQADKELQLEEEEKKFGMSEPPYPLGLAVEDKLTPIVPESLDDKTDDEHDELDLDAIDFSSLFHTKNEVDKAADNSSEHLDKPQQQQQQQQQKDFSHIKVAVRIRPPRPKTSTSTPTTLPHVAAPPISNSMSLRRYNNNSQPSSGYGYGGVNGTTSASTIPTSSTSTPSPAINMNKGPALKIDPDMHTITAAPVPSAHPTTASLMRRRPPASSILQSKEEKKFLFDDAFGSQTSQQQVYEVSVSPLVATFLAGHNSTLLAYGQTGTGKTHTMGTDGIPADVNQAGMLPRVALTVFDHVQRYHKDGEDEYSVECQFLEVYNDDIIDLLKIEEDECLVAAVEEEEKEEDNEERMMMAPEEERPATKDTVATIRKKKREVIHVREADDGQVVVIGAVKESCATFNDLLTTFHRGAKNRSVGSTLMNERSSRSHAIFTIILHRHWRSAASSAKMRSTAKFHLVDLAGSERQRRTGAAGARLKESSNINTGLLALGKVINALAKATKESNGLDNDGGNNNGSNDMAPPAYIPVRDHKLTRLLADSLGGESATVLIACVSPEMENLEESINTLQFANRARKVKVKPEARIKAGLLTTEASVYGTITTVLKEVGISWTRDGKPKLEGLLNALTDNSVWEVLLAHRQAKVGLTGHGLSYIPRLPPINTSSTRAGQVVPLCNPAAAGLLGRQTDKNLQSGDIMEALRREAEGLDDDDMLVRIVGGNITPTAGALMPREGGDEGKDTPLSRLLSEIALRDEERIQQAIEEQMRVKKAQKGALKKVGSVFKKVFGMSKNKGAQ